MLERTFELTLRATVNESTQWPDGTHGFLDFLAVTEADSGSTVAEMISTRNDMRLVLVDVVEMEG